MIMKQFFGYQSATKQSAADAQPLGFSNQCIYMVQINSQCIITRCHFSPVVEQVVLCDSDNCQSVAKSVTGLIEMQMRR
jgi:hypothetical protein